MSDFSFCTYYVPFSQQYINISLIGSVSAARSTNCCICIMLVHVQLFIVKCSLLPFKFF